MTTTGRTGARNYRDRKELSSSDSESSLEPILSRGRNMSDKGLSPSHKRRYRSHSGDRDHYRSRKRSYSPRDRSPSPSRRPPHRSGDRYQHYEGNRRPYGRFPHRPFHDRGQGRGMRRPFRGFGGRNFRYNSRFHDQQGGHYYRDRYQSQGDRGRKRAFSRSLSRSRSHSRPRSRSPPPPRRRSLTPSPKRRSSRSLSPLVSSSVSAGESKSSSFKSKEMKRSDTEKYPKRLKDEDRTEKGPGKPLRSPDSHDSQSGRPISGESKLSFRREDLEKITIDIHRNMKEPSPTLRRIMNPEEVKIIRRLGEGSRPLFEREEIQNPTEDLREEIADRRIISVKGLGTQTRKDFKIGESSIDVRDYAQTEGSSRIPLSKRWQQGEGSAGATSSYSSVPKVHSSINRRSYSEDRDQSPIYDRSRALSPAGDYPRRLSIGDRDLYRDSSIERSFDRHYPDDPGDLRHSLSSRRKDDTFDEGRRKFLDRSDWHGSDSSSRRRFKGEIDRPYRSRSRSPLAGYDSPVRGRSEERLPDFSQRPDRFKYNAWTDKPEVIPKGPSYYEHDDRDRGGNRPFRSRGLRTNRFFRPRGLRSGFHSRGGFVPRSVGGHSVRRPSRPFRSSSGYTPRARGYIPRGKDSPSHWEHDMFNKLDKNDDV